MNYHETFTPMAKMVIVCVILAVAAAQNWDIHHIDVQNVFLYSDLDEEVYLKTPPGILICLFGLVCHLKKSLYCLCQAPHYRFAKLALRYFSLFSFAFTLIIPCLLMIVMFFVLMS